MCIVCIANNINRNVYMYLNTRIFPTTGYARVLLFMFIRRELGGTSLGSSLIIFSSFLFFRSLVKNDNINRNQKRTTDTFDVVYFYSLIFLEY